MKDGDSREQIEVAVFSLIQRGLDQLDFDATHDQIERLTRLVSLVSEWATRISLTGHREPLEMARHLVLDAAALANALPELICSGTLADLGSGVGFPGFPIAILHPHLEVALVESRLKRHHLQREACRQLGLSRVTPIHGRSDEVEIRVSDIVVAQAMTRPIKALELMRPWGRPGGLVVLPGSESTELPEPSMGFTTPEVREYRVPETDRFRRIWVTRIVDV